MSRHSPHQGVINYNAGGKQDRLLLGISLLVLGEAFLVGMGASIKYLSDHVPLPQMMLFRNCFALIFVLPFVMRVGLGRLQTQNLRGHFKRALVGVCGMYCMFFSFATLRLSEAVMLKATSPILLGFIAWLLLGERLSKLGWWAIFAAFAGVAVIVRPSELEAGVGIGLLAGVSAAVLVAYVKILVRRLGRTEAVEVIVFYFAAFATVLTLPAALWVWQPIASESWTWLLFIALLATFGQLSITKAYTVAKVSKVAIFSYLSLPIAGFLGWFLWSEVPDFAMVAGSIIITCAGALSVYASYKDR